MKRLIAAVLISAFITPALAQSDQDDTLFVPDIHAPQKPEPPNIFGVQPGSTSRDRLLQRMREVRDAYRKEYGKRDPVGEITECAEVGTITTCYTHPF